MKEKTNFWWIAGIVVIAVYLMTNTQIFSITLLSPQVVYYNVPVEVRFTTNLTNPVITAFYNDIQLFERHTEEINGTNITLPENQSIILTTGTINGSYSLRLENVSQSGIFKFVATEGNISEIQVIEVRRPFVDLTTDIPNLVDEGTSFKLTFKTYTPQGDPLVSDAIDITVYDPTNKEITLTAVKTTTNEYEIEEFDYDQAGNYQFKIKPRKEGFDTKEFSVITAVTQSAGIPLIVWIITFAIAIFIILFLIRRFRR